MFTFAFVALIFSIASRNHFQDQCQGDVPLFSSTCFTILSLMSESLMYFKLIFVNGIRWGSNFIFWHVNSQFWQYHLLKCILTPLSIPKFNVSHHMLVALMLTGLFFSSWQCSIALCILFYASYHTVLIIIAFYKVSNQELWCIYLCCFFLRIVLTF